MSIIKTGTITVGTGGVAQNLNLGFIPSVFRMRNDTILASGTVTGITQVYWDEYLGGLSTPYTEITTCTAGAPVISRLASGTLAATTGVIPFQTKDSALFLPNQVPYTTYESTNLVITAISQAANASITATHSFTTADVGVTVVTFHGVVGMTQINGLSGVIQSVTSTTSFTVNINSTNFSAYVSGGIANVITGAPANTLYGNVSLPTAQANLGIVGVRLGSTIMANTNDVWYYEAILNYPGLS